MHLILLKTEAPNQFGLLSPNAKTILISILLYKASQAKQWRRLYFCHGIQTFIIPILSFMQ
jgi:hypothetical protein